MTLIEFLLARIAEDEAEARAASPGPWTTSAEEDEVLAVDGIPVADGFALSGRQLRATARHIARHDPARVLAECEAKRRIVELAGWLDNYGGTVPPILVDVPGRLALRLLALLYADHPSFDPAWAVE